MKNQVNKEEQALGKRVREHEFSFDPAALAGFESLLAAEDGVAGKTSRELPPVPVPASPFRKVLTGLLLLVVTAGVALAGWYWYGQEAPVATAEPPTTAAAPLAETENGKSEGEAPAVEDHIPASVPDIAPARRRPDAEPTTTAVATPAPAFTPMPQPTTLARRPLPMPRTGEEGQAPPRPLPTSGYATEQPAHNRSAIVSPLPSDSYRVSYLRALPEVNLILLQPDGWRP